jgi:hypothetical protein
VLFQFRLSVYSLAVCCGTILICGNGISGWSNALDWGEKMMRECMYHLCFCLSLRDKNAIDNDNRRVLFALVLCWVLQCEVSLRGALKFKIVVSISVLFERY